MKDRASSCKCPPKIGSGHCNLCCEDVPAHDLLGHLRVMHPDVDQNVETWPDGGIVMHDDSPSIEDFLPGDEGRPREEGR